MRFVVALCLIALPSLASAQGAPTLLAEYRAWEAYRYDAGGDVTCYILSKPTRLEPTDRNHGDVFFFLSTRPKDDVTNEASFMVGYPFEDGSEVVVDVDGREFVMFTQGDRAWVKSTADEQQLVAAMRAGRTMIVRGRSARGTDTRYSFSLSGVTAGSNRVSGDCAS